VQAILTLAAIIGLIVYHRRPHLHNKLLAMGLPESFAEEWEAKFPEGFALALATIPADQFDDAQEAFTEDPRLLSLLAVDRRLVL
jgi:hypothetical protein